VHHQYIFLYLNKRPENLDWLAAGMSYIMLPAVLHIRKYMWLMFYSIF